MTFNSRIQFVCDGVSVDLTLDGPFVLSAGLKPNINSARCSYLEFDRLGSVTGERVGEIRFYFSSGTSADHVIKDVALVNVESIEVGVPATRGQAKTLVYRLFFADFRRKFQSPRGGNLRVGLINPAGTDPTLRNSDLITACLAMMGIDKTTRLVGGGFINDRPEVRDLEWYCSHAPSELAKLLDLFGMAFCPQSDGTAVIAIMGAGSKPEIPTDRALWDLAHPGLDVRGAAVVFTSVSPVVEVRTIQGPNAATWEFVAKDSDGKWKNVHDLDALNGKEPQTFLQEQAANFTMGPDQFQVADQLYRFIRLKRDFTGGKLVRLVREGPAAGNVGIVLKAPIATPAAGGFWANSTEPVSLAARFLHHDNAAGEAGILQFDQRIGIISPAAKSGTVRSVEEAFGELPDGSMHIRVGTESAQKDNNGKPLKDKGGFIPEHFQAGFRRGSNGEVEELSAADLRNAIVDKETIWVVRPWVQWREIKPDNSIEEYNRIELVRWAKDAAGMYLRTNSGQRMLAGIGFFKIDLSGRVTKISISQKPPRTDVSIDTWYTPLDSHRADEEYGDEAENNGGGGQSFQRQAASQSARSELGSSSAQQSVVPLMPASGPAVGGGAGGFLVKVVKFAGLAGSKTAKATFTYTVKDTAGNELGREIPQLKPRPYGKMNPGDSYAWAVILNGGLYLWDAGETPFTGGC